MKTLVFLCSAVIALSGCDKAAQEQKTRFLFCETRTPYVFGVGFDVFEGTEDNYSKYRGIDGIVKGDRIWEVGRTRELFLSCNPLAGLDEHLSSKATGIDQQIAYVWHTHAIIRSNKLSYGISINFVDSTIRFERLIHIKVQPNLLKSDLSQNGGFVQKINRIKNMHPCMYSALKDNYKYAEVKIGDKIYKFTP